MNKQEFNALAGSTLYFKPMSIEDTKAMHSYASDQEVSRFIGWPLMNTVNEMKAYIEKMNSREVAGSHLYANVLLKSTNEIIGTVMIFNFDHEARHAEIGYVFDRKHWGKGYGTEAISLMCKYAFDVLKLHKLHARVVDVNIGSARVLEKNEFNLEGRLIDYYFIEDNYYDGLFYGRLSSEL